MSGELPTKPHEVWIMPEIWGGPGAESAFYSVVNGFSAKLGLQMRDVPVKALDRFDDLKPEFLPTESASSLSASTKLTGAMQRAVKNTSEQYFREYGVPSAILHTFADRFKYGEDAFTHSGSILTPQTVFLSGPLKTTAWDNYLPSYLKGLAPHSRTVDNLRSEATRLHQLLKPDDKQLIAIVITYEEAIDGVRDSLNNLPCQYPDVRFVISSSPRTDAKKFTEFCQDFSVLLSASQKANMISYNFNSDETIRNPYAGLLSTADHMIVVGDSASMISERLSAGKSVHYAPSHGLQPLSDEPASLIETGKVRYFPSDGRLVTKTFSPINATSMIIDSLVDQYRQHLQVTQATPGYSLTGMLRHGIQNTLRGLMATRP